MKLIILNAFDDTDYYLSAELKANMNKKYSANVLIIKVKYTNGGVTWHPIDLVKDEDPHITANYIITNDLGSICNMIHGLWARLFLRSRKSIVCNLLHSDVLGFDATSLSSVTAPKKQRSRRYAKKTGRLLAPHIRNLGPKRGEHSSLNLKFPKLGWI